MARDHGRMTRGIRHATPNLADFVPSGFTFSLIKYAPNDTCLEECKFFTDVKEQTSSTEAKNFIKAALNEQPNIDSIIAEICLIYLQQLINEERKKSSCFTFVDAALHSRYFSSSSPPSLSTFPSPSPPLLPSNFSSFERLYGNSLSSSYTDSTQKHTLNQYPWTCSLRTSEFRGRHVCGATLLSAPPSKTVIVSAAHCNYICKSSDGKIKEICCCRDPRDNFGSCRLVTLQKNLSYLRI